MLCICGATIAYAHEAVEYLGASREFENIILRAEQDHDMPRIADKRAAELIATLSDSERFLDSTTYRLKDLGSLIDICTKSNAVVMSYALFDLKRHREQNMTVFSAAQLVQKVMVKNFLRYQEEMEQLQPFLFRCYAKQIPLLGEFIATLKPEEFTATRRGGLQQARNGIFEAYYSGVLIASGPAFLKESYRIKMLQTLAETAPQFASLMQLTARRKMLEIVNPSQDTVSDALKVHVRKIADAMSDTTCTGLCRF